MMAAANSVITNSFTNENFFSGIIEVRKNEMGTKKYVSEYGSGTDVKNSMTNCVNIKIISEINLFRITINLLSYNNLS